MDFSLSKKEILFQQMIRAFAEKEVKPLAAEVDEEERFPVETVEKMAKLGIMGIPFPVEYGGAGGDNVLYLKSVSYCQNPSDRVMFLGIACVQCSSFNRLHESVLERGIDQVMFPYFKTDASLNPDVETFQQGIFIFRFS